MSTVNLNTNASALTDVTSTETATTTSKLSAAEWRKLLLAEMQKKDETATDNEVVPMLGGNPPPPPSAADLKTLLETAVTKGVLTSDEASSLSTILAKRQAQHVKGTDDDMKALFNILKAYMEDTDDTETTATNKDTSTTTYTVEELKAKMKADKAARLAKLKAAVAAAQAAGALTTDQLTKINTFITEEETLTAGMDKMDAAGLKA